MATPAPILVSSIGMADSIILMILALVVFGPRKLPQIGRQIGKLMYEFRKASNDFKFQMEEELRMAEEADRRQKEEAERQRMLTAQAAVSAQPALTDPTAVDLAVSAPAAAPATAVEESVPEVHLPRVAGPVIQPPSTGETVAASHPTALPEAEPVAAVEAPSQSAGIESGTETVTQHG